MSLTRPRCLHSSLLAAAGLVLFARTALAQNPITLGAWAPSLDEIRRDYRVHAGPLYVHPSVWLKELGVDSNVFNAPDQSHPQSDFTFTVTPYGRFALPISNRGLLLATVGADAVYYQRFTSERSINPQVVVRGEAYATRLALFGEASYLNTRDRPTFEVDIRPRHQDDALNAGARYRLTPKFSVEGALLTSTVRFADRTIYHGEDLKRAFDRDTKGFSVTASQRLSSLTTLAVRYQSLHDRFVYTPERDTDSFSVMPGVEFKPRALISGEAYVGYKRFTPTSALTPEFSGLVAQVALSYTLHGATTFSATFNRDVQYSFNEATPYFVDTNPGVHVRREIVGNFDVIGAVERHSYDYRQPGVTSAANPATLTQVTNVYDVNFGYRLRRDLRVGVSAGRSDRLDVAPLPGYTTLRVRMTLSYGVLQ